MVYRYPPGALAGDYLRTAAGLLVGCAVLSSAPAAPLNIMLFGALTLLFGFFGYRTLQRHLTRVAVTDDEIRAAGLGRRSLAWGDLATLKLRYFGTRRQARSEGGFMQLSLKGAGASLSFESSLDGFDYIAWRAAKAMRANGLAPDSTTLSNLSSLGLDVGAEMRPPEPARAWAPEGEAG